MSNIGVSRKRSNHACIENIYYNKIYHTFLAHVEYQIIQNKFISYTCKNDSLLVIEVLPYT